MTVAAILIQADDITDECTNIKHDDASLSHILLLITPNRFASNKRLTTL